MNTIKRRETWKQLEKRLTSQTEGKKEIEIDHLFTSNRSSSVFKWVQQCLHSSSVLWKRRNASCVKMCFFKRVSLGLISSWLPAPTSVPSLETDLLRRKQSSANRFRQQSSLSSEKQKCDWIKSGAGKTSNKYQLLQNKGFKKAPKPASKTAKNITTESQCDDNSIYSCCERCEERPKRWDGLL